MARGKWIGESRFMLISIGVSNFLLLIAGEVRIVLPDGCEVFDVYWDPQRRSFVLRIWHKEFEIVKDGDSAPFMEVQYEVQVG